MLENNGYKLRRLAEALVKKGLDGDVTALKEIGDRMDGKSVAQVAAVVDARVIISTKDERL
jgi:hypothetical protein